MGLFQRTEPISSPATKATSAAGQHRPSHPSLLEELQQAHTPGRQGESSSQECHPPPLPSRNETNFSTRQERSGNQANRLIPAPPGHTASQPTRPHLPTSSKFNRLLHRVRDDQQRGCKKSYQATHLRNSLNSNAKIEAQPLPAAETSYCS